MSPIEFGEQIRVRRLEQHLELEEFAKMLGTTRRHLAEMERGRFVSTDVVWIWRLDEVLDSPPHDLLAFTGFDNLMKSQNGQVQNLDSQRKHDEFDEFVDFSDSDDQRCHATLQC